MTFTLNWALIFSFWSLAFEMITNPLKLPFKAPLTAKEAGLGGSSKDLTTFNESEKKLLIPLPITKVNTDPLFLNKELYTKSLARVGKEELAGIITKDSEEWFSMDVTQLIAESNYSSNRLDEELDALIAEQDQFVYGKDAVFEADDQPVKLGDYGIMKVVHKKE